NATVSLATSFGIISRDRITRTITVRLDTACSNFALRQIIAHAVCTLLTQCLVQLSTAGGVGMATDFDGSFVKFSQHQCHGIQHVIEVRTDNCATSSEGNIARHNQINLIAFTTYLNPGTLQTLTQRSFLAIHVITYTTTDGTTGHSTGKRTLFTVALAGRRCANYRTGYGTNSCPFSCVAGFLLPRVGIS